MICQPLSVGAHISPQPSLIALSLYEGYAGSGVRAAYGRADLLQRI
jgi:hypothetical protein